MKKNRLYFLTAALVACFLMAVIPVSAVSITESPSTITSGGLVTITMTDLNDGSEFSILIDGEFNVNPGDRFSFQTNSFTIPIALNNGKISATTQGTKSTSFSARKGGTTVSNVQSADAGGFYSFSQAYNVAAGTIDYLKLEGRARDDVSSVTTSMNLVGTKAGAKNSQISFNVGGIENGLMRVTIYVDGQAALPTKTITIGSGLSPVTTTTTAVPTSTTTAVTTTTTTATTTGTITSSQTTTTTTSTATTATTTGTTTTTTATTALAKTFYSADHKVSLATEGVDYAGFMMVKGATVPADWLAVSDIYTIVPDSLSFSPKATLAFTVPASGADYAYFVGKYENGQWTTVATSAGTDTINARISGPGTFGLMAYKPESTLSSATVTTASGNTAAQDTNPATQVMTAKGTPRIASVAAAATSSAAAASSPAPWLPTSPFLVFCALAICCALVLRRE
ncbi:MAG: hypothetical protein WC379_08650 [Methanoregula sp.]